MFIPVIIGIGIFIGFSLIGIVLETIEFNHGVCPVCGKKLLYFDSDSQGGRGHRCPNWHYSAWVSYNCVDKEYRKEKENEHV